MKKQNLRILSGIMSMVTTLTLCSCNGAKIESDSVIPKPTSSEETGTTDNQDTQNIKAESKTDSKTETDSKIDKKEDNKVIKTSNGKFSEKADKYVGEKGTGDYNYGEALQKSLLFYELQRSGKLPKETRCNWRGDSGLNDGADVNLDLTGGLYDAGDNVKFNLPMAYTSAMLAWSVYETKDAYEKSGQLDYALETIKWVNDYLIKCHPEDDVYYYQVGDGGADHGWWGACEVMNMERPSYCVTKDNGGSAVSGEAAASLAACSVVFKDKDKKYSELCLKHAKSLYEFSAETLSDDGYTAANGFYNSWSGFYDELAWSACWLYIATGDKQYLEDAKKYMDKIEYNPEWTQCWDDVSTGANLLLCKLTDDKKYQENIQANLNYWLNDIEYTPKGLAFADQWGSLRYATTSAFIAKLYSTYDNCPKDKTKEYSDFALSQVNYALGSSGRSFVVGFGENSPQHPHHRTSQGSWCDNMNEPAESRHTLYGALVGGPNNNDEYTDEVSNYTTNEVACDYNAGFTGALALFYNDFKGQTIENFGAVEDIGEEYSAEYCVNVDGENFVEIKAVAYNKTAWCARNSSDVCLRYFVDLSEVFEDGGSEKDITVTANFADDGTTISELKPWNKDKNLYYVEISFDGENFAPGSQSSFKNEIQFRIANAGSAWDNSNDPSYTALENSAKGELVSAEDMAMYENGELVFGSEPSDKKDTKDNSKKDADKKEKADKKDNSKADSKAESKKSAKGDNVSLSIEQGQQSGNTISFTAKLKNTGKSDIDLSKAKIYYYFSPDSDDKLNFYCDNSAIVNGDSYTQVSDIVGEFEDIKTKDETASKACVISLKNSATLAPSAEWSVQVRISKENWSDFNMNNDYSKNNAEKMCVIIDGKEVCGKLKK